MTEFCFDEFFFVVLCQARLCTGFTTRRLFFMGVDTESKTAVVNKNAVGLSKKSRCI